DRFLTTLETKLPCPYSLANDAAIRSAVVWRAKRSQQCNRLREASQPITPRCNSRLRYRWQRDRNARAQWGFQRVVRIASPYGVSVSTTLMHGLPYRGLDVGETFSPFFFPLAGFP